MLNFHLRFYDTLNFLQLAGDTAGQSLLSAAEETAQVAIEFVTPQCHEKWRPSLTEIRRFYNAISQAVGP